MSKPPLKVIRAGGAVVNISSVAATIAFPGISAYSATKSAVADIVTEADREVEALIRNRLAGARPEDGSTNR